MAQSEFDSEADVSILLNLMARDSDIQAGFGRRVADHTDG